MQMMLILAIAALCTFLSSASLVSFGFVGMGVRYGLAVVAGYLFFLSLVRIWIAYQTRNWRFGRHAPAQAALLSGPLEVPDLRDVPDLSALGDLADLGDSAGHVFSGAGGGFGGGGADGSFELDGAGDAASDVVGAVGSADEGVVIVIALVAVLGGLIALGFVVYSSPILFAEVLLDVAVVGAVYKKNKRHERGHWARGVLRRTYKSALALAFFAAVFGFAVQSLAPQEHTLGAVLEAYEGAR